MCRVSRKLTGIPSALEKILLLALGRVKHDVTESTCRVLSHQIMIFILATVKTIKFEPLMLLHLTPAEARGFFPRCRDQAVRYCD